jgi:tRNA (guanine37-N1)-methyltransferase
MQFDLITLFPDMFHVIADDGITSRARARGLWDYRTWNPRDFVHNVHRTVDDRPFGGGPGMVMMAEPLALSVEAIRAQGNRGKVISFAPNGVPLTDAWVRKTVSEGESLILVCGRYEGIDQRFLDTFVDETLSIGDYVLSGGELAAMVVMDAVVRQLPGALKSESTQEESFADGLLDGPHYTRPVQWRGMDVPEVLLGGHHKQIQEWRRRKSLQITATKRPNLVKIARSKNLLSREDEEFLRTLESQD